MIVHHFGQREKRSGQQRDQKPKQAETDQAGFLKSGREHRCGDENHAESEPDPEARVVGGCKRAEVVVRRKGSRPKESFEIEPRDVGLREQIIVRAGSASGPGGRRHPLDEPEQAAAN